MKIISKIGLATLSITLFAPLAGASVLTFQTDLGGAITDGDLATYGDNIAATTQNGFSYGAEGGFTPGVTVSFQNFSTWGEGYGDLPTVIWGSTSSGSASLTFTADSGPQVRLQSFDLAGYFEHSSMIRTLDSITVSNGSASFTMTNVDVTDVGRTSIDFGSTAAAVGQSVTVTFTKSGGEFDYIGASNFQIAAVPEPATLAFGALAIVGILQRRRRRQ